MLWKICYNLCLYRLPNGCLIPEYARADIFLMVTKVLSCLHKYKHVLTTKVVAKFNKYLKDNKYFVHRELKLIIDTDEMEYHASVFPTTYNLRWLRIKSE